MASPSDTAPSTEDDRRVPVIASPRARRFVFLAALVLIVALIAYGTTTKPPTSHYPVLNDATGYGTFTSFTSRDLIFYLVCARTVPGERPVTPGFYQIPGEGLTYHDYQVDPTTHHATTIRLSEQEFIANSRHVRFHGYVIVTPTTRLVTNAPGPNLCD